jgi:hypothetical protein
MVQLGMTPPLLGLLSLTNRASDGIDLESLPFSTAAFNAIDSISKINITADFSNATKIDVHGKSRRTIYNYLVKRQEIY